MAIESATYINQLDPSNPTASDLLADTDNHLRIVKQTLKNTFPNITGPVTLTQHGLNGAVPIGGIIIWSGAANAIPSGWTLCDGTTNITRSDAAGTINAPNLRDRFIVGAGSSYTVGATGGSIALTGTTSADGSHNHPGSTDTQGAHSHTTGAPKNGDKKKGDVVTATDDGVGHNHTTDTQGAHQHSVVTDVVAAHTHTVAIADGRPPYYALCYIMRY